MKVLTANTETLLYGGSGSGKTFFLCHALAIRAWKHPGSRHAIVRSAFKHAKASIWLDTLRKIMRYYPSVLYDMSETDHVVRLQNGSEIWVEGLDEKDRAEKFLGREYSTIYFNEISQISYPAALLAKTRLRQIVPGLKRRLWYDMNPSSRFHWSYQYFIQHRDPVEGKPIDPEGIAAFPMNPGDNPNLDADYMRMLDKLPEAKRRRFFLGEFTDAEGAIFSNWSIVDEIPEEAIRNGRERYGLDYGFTVDPAACVRCILHGDHLYLDEVVYETGLVNAELFQKLTSLPKYAIIRADSAEKKSNEEARRAGLNVYDAAKGPDSIRAGIDWLQTQKILITRRSQNIINEFQSYTWRIDSSGKPSNITRDDFNHAIDAIRYASEEYRKPRLTIAMI